MHPRVRAAVPTDVPVLLELVHELAADEREPDAVEATEDLLAAALFGGPRRRLVRRGPGRRDGDVGHEAHG